jgi:hypothetical protein
MLILTGRKTKERKMYYGNSLTGNSMSRREKSSSVCSGPRTGLASRKQMPSK